MSLCDTCKHYSRTIDNCSLTNYFTTSSTLKCDRYEKVENNNPTPVHPTHYSRLNPEPIDVISSWGINYDLGNVIKYVARAGHKDGNSKLQDLEKAKYCLEHEINILKSSV
jgi:hypothetical protein